MELSQAQLLVLEGKVAELLKTTGELLTQEWQKIQTVSLKDLQEPVTEFDVRMENSIRAELAKVLPEAGFIVEEGQNAEASEYNWVIDPIDQTKNFIGRIPLFYTQVALVHKGEPVLAVVYHPVSLQLFAASLGNGVRLNGEPLISVFKDSLADSLVDVDMGGNSDGIEWKIPIIKTLAESAYRIRMTGGSFAPYLVTGGIHGFVVLNQKTKVVDQLPRILLAREAGLVFEKCEIKGHFFYICGTKNVFEEIKKCIERS
jgi:fructose-1,6-bisphosphatase/inositol monophosphatase family enzyme